MRHNIFATLFCKKRLRIRNPSARPYVPCKTFEEWRAYVHWNNMMTEYLKYLNGIAEKMKKFTEDMRKRKAMSIDVNKYFDHATHTPLN